MTNRVDAYANQLQIVDTQRQSQDNDIVSKIRTYVKGLPHSRLEKITIEIGGVTTIIHTSESEV